jgi:hypothetical protein
VNSLTKNSKSLSQRTHAATAQHRPVCGGGNGARKAGWQEDFAAPNCKRCLTILDRRAKKGAQS